MLQTVQVGNTQLDIDLVEELEPYINGYRVRWLDDKVVAPSPFRYDKSPSFFVNLINLPDKNIAGTFKDSGASEDDEYYTGKFEKLLAFFRNETVEETIDYLREKYEIKAYDKLTLHLDFKLKEEWTPLKLEGTECAVDYLEGRGINAEVGYKSSVMDLEDKVAFHWINPRNEIVAIKYRMKDQKTFWYAEGGKRLNEQLYNIQRVYNSNFTAIWLTEAEIDALSVESTVPRWVGLALGGSSFSDSQRDLIIRAGIPVVVIATDNDKQGERVANLIKRKLKGFVTLYRANMADCKDVNEYVQKYGQLPLIEKVNQDLFEFQHKVKLPKFTELN